MSKTLVQPVGQKRLTNVAVVRLKKQGSRFEVACYKNKVLSWRSGVEKDIDEVLQSHTVYSNVSKGVLANSNDLIKFFKSDDHTKICLEILDKGELQVAGKERESQFSSQFRDIATIVMQKTINPETQRPYIISMVERLMHEIHFAVDPHSNSKKQVCEMEPRLFRKCDSLMRNMQGRLEILAVSVHAEGHTSMDHYDEHDDIPLQTNKHLLLIQTETDPVVELSKKMHKQEMGTVNTTKKEEGTKCSTCNTFVGEAKQYIEHCKSDWHKHNLKRKTRKLPPLTAEQCMAEIGMDDSKADLKDYSF